MCEEKHTESKKLLNEIMPDGYLHLFQLLSGKYSNRLRMPETLPGQRSTSKIYRTVFYVTNIYLGLM